jgi:hypothetical protein
MKVDQTFILKESEDSDELKVVVRKVFRDGSVWLESEKGYQYFSKIYTQEEIEKAIIKNH